MSTADIKNLLLHLLAVQEEDGTHVIHCLDFDIAAQGDTEDEARTNLGHAIELLLQEAEADGDASCVFQSAPTALWDIYVRTPNHIRGRLDIATPERAGRAQTEERRSAAPSAA